MKRMVLAVMFLVFMFAVVTELFAYDDGDWQLWNTDGVDVKLNDRLKVAVNEELRFGDNMSELYYVHTEGGVVLKVNDNLELSPLYRYIQEKKKGKWYEENRPEFDATLKWKLGIVEFKDRSRFELSMPEGKKDSWKYRNKLTAEVPFKVYKIDTRPYLADEIFLPFEGGGINRNRFYAGVAVKLFKYFKADIYYMLQSSETSTDKWTDYNVLGVKATLSF